MQDLNSGMSLNASPNEPTTSSMKGRENAETASIDRTNFATEEMGTRSVFVIARKGEDPLQSPVIDAGDGEDQGTIAIFSAQSTAQLYLQVAGWEESHELVSYIPANLHERLMTMRQQGVTALAINPNRHRETEGEPQQIIPLADLESHSGEEIFRMIQESTLPQQRSHQRAPDKRMRTQ